MPLPSTMTPIATNTLTTATASVTFSNLPQGYTDLVLVYDGTRSATGNSYIGMRFNSDSGTNYSYTTLYGDGTSASSGRTSNSNYLYTEQGDPVNTTQNNKILQFMNYSNTTTNKTVLMRSNNAGREVATLVGLWRNTSAITNISLTLLGGTTPNWASGSTFTLYGVKAA